MSEGEESGHLSDPDTVEERTQSTTDPDPDEHDLDQNEAKGGKKTTKDDETKHLTDKDKQPQKEKEASKADEKGASGESVPTPDPSVGRPWVRNKMAFRAGFAFGLLVIVLCVLKWTRAIPWGFMGSNVAENKSGRVPEFDKFLNEHAEILSDTGKVKDFLPRFIEMTRSVTTDSECTQYYTTVLMKIADDGLDTAMARERRVVNKLIAMSLGRESSTSLLFVMKKRHILDAFVDAASLHAWPHIRAKHEL